jgi:hypothetical protein
MFLSLLLLRLCHFFLIGFPVLAAASTYQPAREQPCRNAYRD